MQRIKTLLVCEDPVKFPILIDFYLLLSEMGIREVTVFKVEPHHSKVVSPGHAAMCHRSSARKLRALDAIKFGKKKITDEFTSDICITFVTM